MVRKLRNEKVSAGKEAKCEHKIEAVATDAKVSKQETGERKKIGFRRAFGS